MNPIKYELSLVLTCIMSFAYISVLKAFNTIYITIGTNIESFVDDISMTVACLNVNIDRKMSTQTEMKQFIVLHLHCYRQVKFVASEIVLYSIRDLLIFY